MTSLDVQKKVEEDFARKGYKHGPFLQVRKLAGGTPEIWEVELAHPGQTGRSETMDPSSIELLYDASNDLVKIPGQM